MQIVKALFLLCAYSISVISYAETVTQNCDHGYTEEVIATKVPYTAGIFFKEQTVVEISGVLWMPCKDYPKPYPLVIYSHGSQHGGVQPIPQRRSLIGRIFTERGYAVFAPIRKGFNRRGSPSSEANSYSTEPTSCNNLQENESGLQSAISDTRALFDVLRSTKRDEIDFTKITLTGHSRGGFLAIALAANGFPGVVRVINFSGGWTGENCDSGYTHSKFGEFGRNIKIPVNSFYGDMDNYYGERFIDTSVKTLERGGTPSTLNIIQGARHNLVFDLPDIWIPLVFQK